MEFWRNVHGCTGQRGDPLPKREGNAEDPTNIWLIEWTGCKVEGAVKLFRINGGGHDVPSLEPSTNKEPRKRPGDRNGDISAVDEFWKFASKFSR